jgi:hypothetical protein
MVVADVDRRVTIAYVMNKMSDGMIGDARSGALIREAYKALDG